MTIRSILLTLSLGMFALKPAMSQESQPNIVMIVVDDMRPVVTALNDLPNSPLKNIVPNIVARTQLRATLTPSLDAVSRIGITFANAYTSSPRCCPSRTAMLTGNPAFNSGYYVENSHTFRETGIPGLADALTLPQQLRALGYYTIGWGKVFHTERPLGTHDWPDVANSWDNWLLMTAGTLNKTKPSNLTNKTNARLTWGTEKQAETLQYDTINSELAHNLLKNGTITVNNKDGLQTATLPKDQPFFFAVGLKRPHTPWSMPKAYLERIPRRLFGSKAKKLMFDIIDDTMDLSKLGRRSLHINGNKNIGKLGKTLGISRRPEDLKKGKGKGGQLPYSLINAKLLKRYQDAIRHYLACTSYADKCIGRVIQGILSGPYANNTVIVIVSDHGYHLGDKLHIGKTTIYEPATRSLMMMVDLRPNGKSLPKGVVVDTPVSLVDLYPTLISIAGGKAPAAPGREDLTPLLKTGVDPNPNRVVVSSIKGKNASLRMGRWKLLSFSNGADLELYDMNRDPYETNNLLSKENQKKLSKSEIDKLNATVRKIQRNAPRIK